MRLLRVTALFLVLFAGAVAAQPQVWVTYAYDAATDAWGLAWGKTDRQATINDAETAKANALRFCRNGPAGSTCEVLAVRCG